MINRLIDFIYIFITGKVVSISTEINVYNSYTGARRDSECHFGSGDAQTQSTNDEAELQEQPRRREMTHLTGKNESRPYF